MFKKYIILCGTFALLAISISINCKHNLCNKKAGEISVYDDEYPSYQCKNAFGKFDHCLRACHALQPGVIIGSAKFVKTENEFIALHKSKEFRHVAMMGFKKEGAIQWGKVNGKMALVNHACDPNCELTIRGDVVTIKAIYQDEELTIAYDTPIIGIDWNPQWNFQCLCNSNNCRKLLDGYDWQKKPRQLEVIG